jgi:putative membrane protein
MSLFVRWLLNAVALGAAAYMVDGIYISGFFAALLAAIVLGIVNTIIKPVFIILTLPINLLSLGLFTFVINGLMLFFAAAIVPGFAVTGILSAVLGSIIISLVSFLLASLVKE